ncbi:hypothetical protein H8356DRAFT_1361578 [Neocallimastix lanati (nom. inval.)]|nr:hypothetical protein H8356DRAFT_1361578 [Neocallimastix sp. JGI-2020a]
MYLSPLLTNNSLLFGNNNNTIGNDSDTFRNINDNGLIQQLDDKFLFHSSIKNINNNDLTQQLSEMTVRLVQQLTSNTNDSSLKSSKLQLNGTGKMTNFYFIPQLIANTNVTSQLTSFLSNSSLNQNLNLVQVNSTIKFTIIRDADEACFIQRWKCLLCPLLTINKSNSNLNKSSSSLTQQLIENINGSSQYHSYLVQQLSIKLIIINGYGLISPLIPQLRSQLMRYINDIYLLISTYKFII